MNASNKPKTKAAKTAGRATLKAAVSVPTPASKGPDRLLLAGAHERFAEELHWLVTRSLQCMRDGRSSDYRAIPLPKYPPPTGLADTRRGVANARLRAEARGSKVTGMTAGELITLLAALQELAKNHQEEALEHRRWAEFMKGRPPTTEEAFEKKYARVFGVTLKRPAASQQGRPGGFGISDRAAASFIAGTMKEKVVDRDNAALDVARVLICEKNTLADGARPPQPGPRLDSAINDEAKRLLARALRWTQTYRKRRNK